MNNIPKSYYQIDEKRFKEKQGLFYDDFEIDDIIEHYPGRTLTQFDNIFQTLISLNTHPLHFDSEFAKKTEFEKPLINSAITFSIVNGMTVKSLSANAICNLGWDKVKLVNPVFCGDTLYAESKIISKRLSKSRKNAGIVTVETKGLNQNKSIVITFNRTFMVKICDDNLY